MINVNRFGNEQCIIDLGKKLGGCEVFGYGALRSKHCVQDLRRGNK